MCVGRCRSVVGLCSGFMLLIFSVVGRCRLFPRKKLYSRVIFQPIFCVSASSDGFGGVVVGSGCAWPETYVVVVSGAGKVEGNTVLLFHGEPVLHLSVPAWSELPPGWPTLIL